LKSTFKILALLFLFTTLSFAQRKIPPIMTDRPDFTESPVTLYKGFIQIETGALYTNEKFNDASLSVENNRLSIFSTLVRIGLTDYFELRLGGEYLNLKEKTGGIENSSNGLNALLAGGKVQLLSSENSFADIGLLCELLLPIGSENFKPETTEPRVYLAVNHNLPSGFALSYNYGMQYVSSDDNYFHFGSLSVSNQISSDFGVFVETFGFIQKSVLPKTYLDAGIMYLFTPKTQMDIYLGSDLTQNFNSFFVGVGFSIRFPD